jgi:hypothetical protein
MLREVVPVGEVVQHDEERREESVRECHCRDESG